MAGQEQACREFCQRNNYDVVRVFRDEAASAKTFDRPAWTAMQQSLRRDKINFIVVQKYDRFSRNVAEGLEMFERLEKRYNIRVLSVQENLGISPFSPFFWKFRADALTGAEFERRMIADRTAGGRHAAAKQGRWMGPAPFGYDNARDEKNKPILVLNADESATVREMFQQYASGLTFEQVRSWAKLNGFTARHKEAVKRLLSNPVYAGLITTPAYQGEGAQYVRGLHEPIVPEALFWQVQNRIAGRNGKPRAEKEEALPLRGYLLCQCCQRPLTGSRSRGKSGGHWYYYRCLRCTGQNFRAERAHGEMAAILSALSFGPAELQFLQRTTRQTVERLLKQQQQQARRAETEIAELSAKVESLEAKYIADKVDEGTYRRWIARFNSDISDRQAVIEAARSDEAAKWQRYEAALPELGSMEKIWELCNAEKKAQFLRLLFGEGLQKTNTGYRTPYLIQCLLHNAHKVSALEIKGGTENANFDASGSVCSPYGAKIEPNQTLFALVDFLDKLKAA